MSSRARREMHNNVSDARLQELLVAALPTIAEKLPRHQRSEVVTVGASADRSCRWSRR